MHQLRIIIDLLGTPKEGDIQSIENPKFREMIRSVAIRPPKKLTKLFPNQNEEGSFDLQKLLIYWAKCWSSILSRESPWSKP
jgi:hypothetical protein